MNRAFSATLRHVHLSWGAAPGCHDAALLALNVYLKRTWLSYASSRSAVAFRNAGRGNFVGKVSQTFLPVGPDITALWGRYSTTKVQLRVNTPLGQNAH